MGDRPRILFLINSLNPGGAERQLCELVRHLDPARFDLHLVVFYDSAGGDGDDLWSQAGRVPHLTLTSLHKRRGAAGYLVALPRLLALLLRTRPEVVHGYLEGNLPLLLMGRLLGLRVVWGIRRTSSDWSKLDRLSRLLIGIMVKLARFVDLILFNSEAGLRNHMAMGMRAKRMEVVPNGFDVARFRPEPEMGLAQRRSWGLPEGGPLIGIVGRLDPVKGHPLFLRAAALVIRDWPEARFICIGGGRDPYRADLQELATSLGLGDRVRWPGTCERMTAAYNALSVLVLASTDEGFPNVLGEAMACGIPCVTTRVGDAANLVGAVGLVVEKDDAAAMAEAIGNLLREDPETRADRGMASRRRICERFSVEALARNTGDLLLALLGDTRVDPARLEAP